MGVSIENAKYSHRADLLRNVPAKVRFLSCEPLLGSLAGLSLEGIHWLIAGGESGPVNRPPKPEWIRELRDLCVNESVPFFFKQWGGRTSKSGGRILDGQRWEEYPLAERDHSISTAPQKTINARISTRNGKCRTGQNRARAQQGRARHIRVEPSPRRVR